VSLIGEGDPRGVGDRVSLVLAALIVLFLSLVFRGFLVEPWRIERTVIELELPRLPAPLKEARIVILSDLHTQSWGYRELFIADQLRRHPPDLLLLSGDLISNSGGVNTVLEVLGSVHPRMGVFFVRGNNEVEEIADQQGFIERLTKLGWTILMNEHRKIEGAGEEFYIAGVDDPNNDLDRLDKALEGIPSGAFTVLLAHTPEPFPEAVQAGVNLVVSGHTHGGQVQVPVLGPPWVDTPRTGRMYTSGVYREEGSTLIVSRGVGWSILPLRLFCSPQLIELRLRATSCGPTRGPLSRDGPS